MRKERMNDRGFSLVELIIVIAIMAILIVVLAPQYLRYVERSRNSTDMQNARTMMTAIETWAADPQASSGFGPKDSTVTIVVGDASTTVTCSASTPANTNAGEDALKASGLEPTDIKCSSKTNWQTYTITGTVQESGGIKWAFLPDKFDNAMNGKSGT